MSKIKKITNWTPSLVDEFTDACHTPTGFDYKDLHENFGAPDAYKDNEGFKDWLHSTQASMLTYLVKNSKDLKIIREEETNLASKDNPLYELSFEIDGKFFATVDDLAHKMKTLIDAKMAETKPATPRPESQ